MQHSQKDVERLHFLKNYHFKCINNTINGMYSMNIHTKINNTKLMRIMKIYSKSIKIKIND